MIQRLLHLLALPNAAILLILAGIFLIYAEFNRPGTIVLACCGTFFLTLGIYGLAQHPIRLASLSLLLVGLGLLALALKARTRYPSALAATALIVYSLATLTRPAIHPLVALATGTLFTLVTLPLLRIALRARRNKRLFPNPATRPAPNLQPSTDATPE